LVFASESDFCKTKGVGKAKYVQLLAVLEMSRRALNSTRAARDYLMLLLGGRQQEIFLVLFLDIQHRVIGSEELFQGTFNQTSVYPR
jgi:DNA repair protein RadC